MNKLISSLGIPHERTAMPLQNLKDAIAVAEKNGATHYNVSPACAKISDCGCSGPELHFTVKG